MIEAVYLLLIKNWERLVRRTKKLVSSREIRRIVSRMAKKINRDYQGEELVVIGVLKGSIVFMADLMRRLTMPIEIEFIEVESYDGVESSGNVIVKRDISSNIEGCHVLVVEDILDTGTTMSAILPLLLGRNPRSLKVAAFLDKPSRRKKEITGDYVGKVIPNVFVVGYGLDYKRWHRHLPDVWILEE